MRCGPLGDGECSGRTEGDGGLAQQMPASRLATCWSDSIYHLCRDHKSRRIPASAESLFQRVVNGLPAYLDSDGSEGFPLVAKGKVEHREKLLKGYGNAIVPQVGAAFIRALMEVIS